MSSITWKSRKPSPIAQLKQLIAARAARWAHKRQGRDANGARLESRRIYILPTGVGLVYGLMTVAMLLGSMNYNNNLSFVLTFMLASLGLVAMHACQRNLVGLEISFAGAEPVFAGQNAVFRIAVANPSGKTRYHLQIYHEDFVSDIEDLDPGQSKTFRLELPTERRGHLRLPRFGLRTRFPFDLLRAWTWLHMDLACLVYPQPAVAAPEPPPTETARGHRQHDARGEEDFAGLREFQPGDSPRHIAWKAFARSDDLLSKRFSGADTSSQWFDFASLQTDDVELRLSILTRWIIDAERASRDYGLRIGGSEFPPAHGREQRQRCLEHLATFGDAADAS